MSKTEVSPLMRHTDDRRAAVADRLRGARLALGLSKKEFAERADLRIQTYGPFENAQRDLTLRAAKLLRGTYGLSLEFLYFGDTNDLPIKVAMAMPLKSWGSDQQ